ncbi:MAG: IS3 family transposase [Selenomonadaceae bacterium]|nr:IS3 family transposase [Selenomonadaceae bacterium]
MFIVRQIEKGHKQPELLASVHLPKSSYYYIKQNKADKYCNLRQKIIELFEENKSRYGYRRIHALLVKERIRVSEKIVRRLMREEKLEVKIKRTRKYYSYKGEITPAPANVIARDFHAEKPNEKWLSDLTEFAIPAGKVYLSPMVDCFDGYICAWTIGTNPNADLVNKMLVQAIGTLKDDEHPIIHTDRGCHYRWDGWIALMEKNMLKRSMSAKGCSPDNSACEGFFGRLKNEFFYGRDWRDFSIEDFIATLDDYLHWYNDVRIKKSLGFLSPRDYRQKLGLVA